MTLICMKALEPPKPLAFRYVPATCWDDNLRMWLTLQTPVTSSALATVTAPLCVRMNTSSMIWRPRNAFKGAGVFLYLTCIKFMICALQNQQLIYCVSLNVVEKS